MAELLITLWIIVAMWFIYVAGIILIDTFRLYRYGQDAHRMNRHVSPKFWDAFWGKSNGAEDVHHRTSQGLAWNLNTNEFEEQRCLSAGAIDELIGKK